MSQRIIKKFIEQLKREDEAMKRKPRPAPAFWKWEMDSFKLHSEIACGWAEERDRLRLENKSLKAENKRLKKETKWTTN